MVGAISTCVSREDVSGVSVGLEKLNKMLVEKLSGAVDGITE